MITERDVLLILYNDPWFTPSGSVKKKTIIDENGKTIEVFAMPTALSLCSHSSFMPARAVGATTGEPFAMPAAFLTPNSSLLTPHS